ncbi:MAG: Inosose dehydratase [Planctomycetes bacterium ADurb.Bin126]|nr:MAG: Inosose dehydratase [Planctomycetes bacterium ADurb.Bin126]
MRIGIQQTALGEASLVKSFIRAARAGTEGIGLCYRTAEEARCLGDPRYVVKVRALVERFGLAVTGLHLGVLCADQSLIGPLPLIIQSQDLVRLAITVAAKLGSPDVVVPFFGRNRIELPKEFDTAAAAMSDLAEAAEDHGVTLAIESSLHLSQLQQFLAGCGSDFVKVCMDTGDVTACRHDPASMISGLGRDRIAQVHLKDVRGASGLPPDFNIRLGRGNVGFTGVANALQGVGYGGWLVLETPPGDDRGAIVAAHVEYTRRLFRAAMPSDRLAASKALSVGKGVA